jgi:hypothetical protein
MFLSHLYFLIFVQRRVERFGIGLASLLAKAELSRPATELCQPKQG